MVDGIDTEMHHLEISYKQGFYIFSQMHNFSFTDIIKYKFLPNISIVLTYL